MTCAAAALAAVIIFATTAVYASHHSTVAISGDRFRVEIARAPQAQRRGLGGRDQLRDHTGMLFPFSPPRSHQVWMADMRVSIDIAWIAGDTIVGVRTLHPCAAADTNSCPRWRSPRPVTALLEVPASELHGVAPGDHVRIGR